MGERVLPPMRALSEAAKEEPIEEEVEPNNL